MSTLTDKLVTFCLGDDHFAADVQSVAAAASYAVLVGGDTAASALTAIAGQLRSAGFAQVAVLSGPPPALEEAAARPNGVDDGPPLAGRHADGVFTNTGRFEDGQTLIVSGGGLPVGTEVTVGLQFRF